MPAPAIAKLRHGGRDDPADSLAFRGVEGGRGAFLPHLLMTALQRAVALAEMNRVALAVAEHLDFDVARLFEILLDVNGVVAEGGLGLGAGGRQRVREIVLDARHLHAAPAAARRRLDEHRVADFSGDALGVILVRDAALRARHARDAEALGGALGLDLVAHQADVLGLGADERDAMMVEHLRRSARSRIKSHSPGWTASAPVISQAAMSAGMLR